MTERRTQARERRHHIVVGITAVAGIIGLVILLTAFGYLPTLLRTGYSVTLYLDDAAGLRENSRVTLWGRDIGEVVSIGFAESGDPGKAFAQLRIDREVSIPKDIRVRVQTPLFGGGPVIALVGSELGSQALAKDGTATLKQAQIIDPLNQLENVSKDLAEIKLTWDQVGKNINTLFDQGEGMPSLPKVVLGLEQRLDQLKGVMDGAQAWLGDKKLQDDVKQTAANARKLTQTLDKAVTDLQTRYAALAESATKQLEKVDGMLDKTSASVLRLEKRYVALADDAAKVARTIDGLVAKAGSKDSTIGMLLSDPQLYKNLADSSERIKLLTDEARLLIKKWKAEGVPIRVFD